MKHKSLRLILHILIGTIFLDFALIGCLKCVIKVRMRGVRVE